MLIFDSFPARRQAVFFAHVVKRKFNLEAIVCDTQEEFEKHDIFPFELFFPVVVVERTYSQCDMDGVNTERKIEKLVASFKGKFAGT